LERQALWVTGRIAAASSDGVMIDSHFAQAECFYIYDIANGAYKFVEKRNIAAALIHSEAAFDKVRLLLHDCDAIVVSKVGFGAAQYLLEKGLRVFEAPYAVGNVLQKFADKNILENIK
jgi:nitrogen fixation protein NifX